jgi:hypothetical protein
MTRKKIQKQNVLHSKCYQSAVLTKYEKKIMGDYAFLVITYR